MKKTAYLIMAMAAIGILSVGWSFFGVDQAAAPAGKIEDPPLAHHWAEPPDQAFYETVYSFEKDRFAFGSSTPAAGIVPHHLLSGDMIAAFYHNLESFDYDTVVLLGPNHFSAGAAAVIASDLGWQTPFGVLAADQEALGSLFSAYPGIGLEPAAMDAEHAVKSQAAFIKKTFPGAKFLPLILRPNVSPAEAEKIAAALAGLAGEKKILVLVSADFSHYTDAETAQAQDRESLGILERMDFAEVYGMEADARPAIYAAMKYAALNEAGFRLLANSNSAFLSGRPEIEETTSYITGYFTKGEIRLLFFGDLMLDRHVGEKIADKGLGHIFSGLDEAGFFSGYDLVSANLEGAVTDAGAHYPPAKAYDFAFDPGLIEGLKDYGFNFFNLANNHLDDQGDQGIAETRANLDRLGLAYSGDANGRLSAFSGRILALKGRKIALLGISDLWGAADRGQAAGLARELASSSDLLIANVHWGEEYQGRSNRSQQSFARLLIDSGADIIIGHHPHVVQETGEYKGKPVFYSLGNFVFDQYFSPETQRGLAVEVVYDGVNFRYRTLPFHSRQSRLFPD